MFIDSAVDDSEAERMVSSSFPVIPYTPMATRPSH